MTHFDPLDAARLEVREVGDEVLVYDLETDEVHLLAPETAKAWKDAPAGFDRRAFLRRSAAVGGMAVAGAAMQSMVAPGAWASLSVLPVTVTNELATRYVEAEGATVNGGNPVPNFGPFAGYKSGNASHFTAGAFTPSPPPTGYVQANKLYKPGPTGFASVMTDGPNSGSEPQIRRATGVTTSVRIRPEGAGGGGQSRLEAVRYVHPATRPLTSTGEVVAFAGSGVAVYRVRGATFVVAPSTAGTVPLSFTDSTAQANDEYWLLVANSTATVADATASWNLSYTTS